MARAPSITYEDFKAAASEIEAAGGRATFAAVRGRIGGSYDVIRRYLTRWTEERPQRTLQGTVSANLMGGMQAWFDQARTEAMDRVRAELASEAEALQQERQALDEERVAMAAKIGAAEALAAERERRVMEVLQARDDVIQALTKSQAAEAAATMRADALAAELSNLQAQHATVLTQWREEVLQLKDHHLLEIQKANASAADAMRQALLLRDDLRTAQQKWGEEVEASLRREAGSIRQMFAALAKQQELSVISVTQLGEEQGTRGQAVADAVAGIGAQLQSLQDQVTMVGNLQTALRDRVMKAEEGTHAE